MTIFRFLQLSHREFTAHRTRSLAAVVTVGVLFGLVLAILSIIQGVENVVLCYAGDATGRKVYLASTYDADSARATDLIKDRLTTYHGEIINLPDAEMSNLGLNDNYIVAVFQWLDDAYNYTRLNDYQERNYSQRKYHITELYNNQVAVYSYFRDLVKDLILPLSITLLIVAVFILAFTMSHILAQSSPQILLYRSLGASRGQIFLIYFLYLLELCFYAALFAISLALILAGIVTAFSWSYLTTQLSELYPNSPRFAPILIGMNWGCLGTVALLFVASPVSFLLCLDQFSMKKIAQRLKGD